MCKTLPVVFVIDTPCVRASVLRVKYRLNGGLRAIGVDEYRVPNSEQAGLRIIPNVFWRTFDADYGVFLALRNWQPGANEWPQPLRGLSASTRP